MPPQILTEFERLLQMPDPELHDMILYPEIAPAGDFVALIAAAPQLSRIGMMVARQQQQDAPAASKSTSTGSSEVLSGVPDGLVPLLLGNLIQQAAQCRQHGAAVRAHRPR